jgi:hypothetical protein
MPGHGYESKSKIFNPVFDSASTYKDLASRMEFFARGMERIKQEYPVAFWEASHIKDVNHISAEFLIKNIELAFEAYYRLPPKHRSSFHFFIEYVLPYRASNEPLEFDNRKKQFSEYQWVYEELNSGQTMQQVIHSVLDSLDLKLHLDNRYPGRFSADQIEKVGFAFCTDLVNYAVNVFRAIGIPASNDFTPHWGNRHSLGHNWLALPSEDSLLAIGLPEKEKLNRLYKYESLPKAYRHTYRQHSALYDFTKDVTSAYKIHNQITLLNRWNKNPRDNDVYLMVYDRRNGWFPIDKAKSVNKFSFSFTNVAPHVVFLPGYYDESNTLQPINYPFMIDDQNKIDYLDMRTETTIDSAILKRKYPPYFVIWWEAKLLSIETINGLKIQASNNKSFQPYRDLLTISDYNTTQVQTIPLSYEEKYRYYRITRPDTTTWVWLAKLLFNSEQGYEEVQAKNSDGSFKMNNLEDEDPLSYNGGKGFEVRGTGSPNRLRYSLSTYRHATMTIISASGTSTS